jgi:hypothetical protein
MLELGSSERWRWYSRRPAPGSRLPQSLWLLPAAPATSLVSWPRTSRATIPLRVINPSASANDQQQEPPVDVATGASERRTIGLSDAGDAAGDAGRCEDGRDGRRQLGSHTKIVSSLVEIAARA